MSPLVWRKKLNFSTTPMLCDRYSGFPPLHRKPTKCFKGGRVLRSVFKADFSFFTSLSTAEAHVSGVKFTA